MTHLLSMTLPETASTKNKQITVYILFAFLWIIVCFLPLIEERNAHTYFSQFLEDMSGRLGNDGNLLKTILFQLPVLSIIGVSVIFFIDLIAYGGFNKRTTITSWIALFINLTASVYFHIEIRQTDYHVNFTFATILVPVILLAIALLSTLLYKTFRQLKIKGFNKAKEEEVKMQHVFISYRKSDYQGKVERIVDYLKKNDISVWIDRDNIMPGQDWRSAIRVGVRSGVYFIACFSKNYWSSDKNYMNEELQLAIEEIRKRRDDKIWFIPIKLEECEIPDFEIRDNRQLGDKQFVCLYENWDIGLQKIVEVIKSE